MEIKLTLDATPALLDVLSNMTGALRGLSTPAQHTQQATAQTSTAPAPIVPQQPPEAQVPPANVVPMPAPTPVAVFPVTPPAVPPASAPAAPAAPAAPTAAPASSPTPAPAAMPATYTPQQINQACAPLIDAGKLQELRKIMQDQFGVNSLQNMTAEQLAEFVPIVRGMGAQI